MYYGWCGCTVWPLVAGYPVGRCGRCGRVPVHMMGFDRMINRDQMAALVGK